MYMYIYIYISEHSIFFTNVCIIYISIRCK